MIDNISVINEAHYSREQISKGRLKLKHCKSENHIVDVLTKDVEIEVFVLRLCLHVWRGREGRVLKKRKDQVEEIEDIGRGELWGVNFSS